MDVAKLSDELRVGLHEIRFANRDVAGIESHVADAEEVLGPVAAPSPYAKEVLCAATGHVFDADGYILRPSLFERSRGPTRERPPERRRVDNHDGSPNLAGQLRCANPDLAGLALPGAAVKWRVEGEDGVPCLSARWVSYLVGVPTVVHHDLYPVISGFGCPTANPIRAERVQRTGADDDGGSH